MTEVDGAPEISGARLPALLTTIAKAGSCEVTLPSLTLITMLLNVPTLEDVGVPCKRPVVVLNVAQAGRFVIENVNGSPSASLAVG